MNISYPPIHITNIPPAFEQLGHEFIKATAWLLIPTELLYFSVYFHRKGFYKAYEVLTFLSLGAFWVSPLVAPIACNAARCLQNFAGKFKSKISRFLVDVIVSVAIGTMKLLDIFAKRYSPPVYTAGKQPPDWLYPLIVLTELRYESFTPNHIRVPRNQENFSEPLQLGIHVTLFAVLQAMPQNLPTVLAFEVQLAIYIIWTSIQLLLRYKSSPALFGPLYLADSLTGFW
jgi:hypothetical protein